MKYLLVNPYGEAYGVSSYCRNVMRQLGGEIDIACLSNEAGLSIPEFRKRVRDEVTRKHAPEDVVIEAPEARAATLLLPSRYRVHIRLHGPHALLHRFAGVPAVAERVQAEAEVIRRAVVLSAPSHAVVRELRGSLTRRPVHVYKNPPDPTIPHHGPAAKRYDALFAARNLHLKGADHLASLLRRLPPERSVALLGEVAETFRESRGLRCRLARHGLVVGAERFRVYGEARVLLALSRYENCSMAILESLAAGTLVVGWDRGGNAEIARHPLLRLVRYGDVDALAAELFDAWSAPPPARSMFRSALAKLTEDFAEGWCETLHAMGVSTGPPSMRKVDDRRSCLGSRDWCVHASGVVS